MSPQDADLAAPPVRLVTVARPATGRPPLRLVALATVGAALLLLPLLGLVTRSPWRDLPALVRDPLVGQALWLSLWTATVAMALSVVLGIPLAWVLARTDFRGRSLLRGLVVVPLVMPPVVAGVALLAAFGRRGIVGAPLQACCDLTIPFTPTAVVLAHTFVALPFFVISAEGALRASPTEYDVVAATLGADRWTTFRRVTLPLVRPGVVAGMVLGWARSLGEFGATITFAGNYPELTQTMPLLIYSRLQSDPAAAYALGLVLLAVSTTVLALFRERWLPAVIG